MIFFHYTFEIVLGLALAVQTYRVNYWMTEYLDCQR